jgi:hypothetical protein
LTGQRLRVLFERRYKASGLAFCCEGGPLGSVMLPACWTDRGAPTSPRALGYEQLVELASLVSALGTRRGE